MTKLPCYIVIQLHWFCSTVCKVIDENMWHSSFCTLLVFNWCTWTLTLTLAFCSNHCQGPLSWGSTPMPWTPAHGWSRQRPTRRRKDLVSDIFRRFICKQWLWTFTLILYCGAKKKEKKKRINSYLLKPFLVFLTRQDCYGIKTSTDSLPLSPIHTPYWTSAYSATFRESYLLIKTCSRHW